MDETTSQPRVPEPEMTRGWAAGSLEMKSWRRSESVSPKTSMKAPPTWLSLETVHQQVFIQWA